MIDFLQGFKKLGAIFEPLSCLTTNVDIPEMGRPVPSAFADYGKKLKRNHLSLKKYSAQFDSGTPETEELTDFCSTLYETGNDILKSVSAQKSDDILSLKNILKQSELQSAVKWTSGVYRVAASLWLEENMHLASFVSLPERQKPSYRSFWKHFDSGHFFKVFDDCWELMPLRLETVLKILRNETVQKLTDEQQTADHEKRQTLRKKKIKVFQTLLTEDRKKGAKRTQKSRQQKAEKSALKLTNEQLPEFWKQLCPNENDYAEVSKDELFKKLVHRFHSMSKTQINKLCTSFK